MTGSWSLSEMRGTMTTCACSCLERVFVLLPWPPAVPENGYDCQRWVPASFFLICLSAINRGSLAREHCRWRENTPSALQVWAVGATAVARGFIQPSVFRVCCVCADVSIGLCLSASVGGSSDFFLLILSPWAHAFF